MVFPRHVRLQKHPLLVPPGRRCCPSVQWQRGQSDLTAVRLTGPLGLASGLVSNTEKKTVRTDRKQLAHVKQDASKNVWRQFSNISVNYVQIIDSSRLVFKTDFPGLLLYNIMSALIDY